MGKSSLFADPNRVGKGDWMRQRNREKLREGIEKAFGDREPEYYQQGRKFKKVYKSNEQTDL